MRLKYLTEKNRFFNTAKSPQLTENKCKYERKHIGEIIPTNEFIRIRRAIIETVCT